MLPEATRNKLNYARQLFLQDYLPEIRFDVFEASEWAEPGNTDPSECEETGLSGLLVFTDWNEKCHLCGVSEYRHEEAKHTYRGDITCAMNKALEGLTVDEKLLLEEALGSDRGDWLNIDGQWSDQNGLCVRCLRAVQTDPDSYGWLPHHKEVEEEGIVCDDCIEKDEDLMEELAVNRCVHCDPFDPEKNGFTLVETEYEGRWQRGVYGGQTDNPQGQLEVLNKNGWDVCFRLYSGQFDIQWDLFIRVEGYKEHGQINTESIADEARRILRDCDKCKTADPAEVMKAYMQDASTQKVEQKPGHVLHTSPDPKDPTKAVVRNITREEFIDGSWARKDS